MKILGSAKLLATVCAFGAIWSGCNSTAGSAAGPASDAAPSTAPTVSPTPVASPTPTYPANDGTTTSTYLFDESVNFEPGFSVFQGDSKLSDLFSSSGQSNLCVPTTIANIMAFQTMWRKPNFPDLKLVQTPGQGDYTEQVRYFAELCKTDVNYGTNMVSALQCIRQFYEDSGYKNGWAYGIGYVSDSDATSKAHWGGHKDLMIADLRYYLSHQVGVLMDVQWDSYDGSGNSWTTDDTGHAFWLAGYDYDKNPGDDWGEDQIMLDIVNPDIDYSANTIQNRYDPVLMTRFQRAPGVRYPTGSNYVVEGVGFRGVLKRGFVKSVLVFLPEALP